MMTPKFLFQGWSATLYRESLGFAIYFSTYNALKNAKGGSEISMIDSFTYGAITGSTSWLFIYPQDRFKTQEIKRLRLFICSSTQRKMVDIRVFIEDSIFHLFGQFHSMQLHL